MHPVLPKRRQDVTLRFVADQNDLALGTLGAELLDKCSHRLGHGICRNQNKLGLPYPGQTDGFLGP